MRTTILQRMKSPVVWLAVIAQIIVIAGLFKPEIGDTIKIVGTAIVEILTLFGILNNPTDGEKF